MAYTIQVAVDTADALTLADWWAETLGWAVEETDEAFIDRMFAEGYAGEGDVVVRHGRRVWKGSAAIQHPDDTGPERRRIIFQDVPEHKVVKNRVHLDFQTPDADAARAELERRGARYVRTGSQGPHHWHVMLDPEGNEFCVG